MRLSVDERRPAGDTSYDERLMLAGRVDGVSPDDRAAATLGAIRGFAATRRVVHLPTHDPESAARLAGRVCVSDGAMR